jgi:serine/threonine protein kinase
VTADPKSLQALPTWVVGSPVPPGTRIGKLLQGEYLIKGILGEGELGVTYEAENARLKRKFAVLMLKRELKPTQGMMLQVRDDLRKAEPLSALGVMPVRMLSDQNQIPGFATELLEGETLRQRLRRGPLKVERALSLIRHVARALEGLHKADSVHGDLRPENIFLVKTTAKSTFAGRVIIVEHGLHHLRRRTPGLDDQLPLYKLMYRPPEQLAGEVGPHPQGDVFDLGAVLYECLTGRPAFYDEVPDFVIENLTQPPKPLEPNPATGLTENLAEAVNLLIVNACARDLDVRTPDMTEFIEAIEQLAEGAQLSLPEVAVEPPGEVLPQPVKSGGEVRMHRVLQRASGMFPVLKMPGSEPPTSPARVDSAPPGAAKVQLPAGVLAELRGTLPPIVAPKKKVTQILQKFSGVYPVLQVQPEDVGGTGDARIIETMVSGSQPRLEPVTVTPPAASVPPQTAAAPAAVVSAAAGGSSGPEAVTKVAAAATTAAAMPAQVEPAVPVAATPASSAGSDARSDVETSAGSKAPSLEVTVNMSAPAVVATSAPASETSGPAAVTLLGAESAARTAEPSESGHGARPLPVQLALQQLRQQQQARAAGLPVEQRVVPVEPPKSALPLLVPATGGAAVMAAARDQELLRPTVPPGAMMLPVGSESGASGPAAADSAGAAATAELRPAESKPTSMTSLPTISADELMDLADSEELGVAKTTLSELPTRQAIPAVAAVGAGLGDAVGLPNVETQPVLRRPLIHDLETRLKLSPELQEQQFSFRAMGSISLTPPSVPIVSASAQTDAAAPADELSQKQTAVLLPKLAAAMFGPTADADALTMLPTQSLIPAIPATPAVPASVPASLDPPKPAPRPGARPPRVSQLIRALQQGQIDPLAAIIQAGVGPTAAATTATAAEPQPAEPAVAVPAIPGTGSAMVAAPIPPASSAPTPAPAAAAAPAPAATGAHAAHSARNAGLPARVSPGVVPAAPVIAGQDVPWATQAQLAVPASNPPPPVPMGLRELLLRNQEVAAAVLGALLVLGLGLLYLLL